MLGDLLELYSQTLKCQRTKHPFEVSHKDNTINRNCFLFPVAFDVFAILYIVAENKRQRRQNNKA